MDYVKEANLTLSNKFHGEKVTLIELREAMRQFIEAGNRLDRIKKALFYGKGEDIGLTSAIGAMNCIAAPWLLAGIELPVLTPDSLSPELAQAENAIHGIIGIATEATELVEALNAAMFGERQLDEINVLEEIGDVFWYVAVLLGLYGSDFETEQRRNIAKLRARFPNNFTEYDAINRDVEGERLVLETHNGEVTAAYLKPATPRYARRCRNCLLENGQHRPGCVEETAEQVLARAGSPQASGPKFEAAPVGSERKPYNADERNGE